MNNSSIALIGFDWEVLDLIETLPSWKPIGYTDVHPKANTPIQFLGTDNEFLEDSEKSKLSYVITINSPKVRRKLYQLFSKPKTLISENAYISPRTSLQKGSIIQRNAILMPQVTIGANALIHCNATIHHEVQIGNHSVICPRATVLGRATIGESCFIGAGTLILENRIIGDGATIGAGAVVTKDVAPAARVAGIPAKELVNPR